MNSLDTNVVLRYILNDIPEQAGKSKKVITSSVSYITDVVAVELVYVLERIIGMERSDIVTLLKSFLSLPNLVYNDYFLDQSLDLYGANKTLSIVDCYAATESAVYGNTLITFDKDLVKNAGSHVKEL